MVHLNQLIGSRTLVSVLLVAFAGTVAGCRAKPLNGMLQQEIASGFRALETSGETSDEKFPSEPINHQAVMLAVTGSDSFASQTQFNQPIAELVEPYDGFGPDTSFKQLPDSRDELEDDELEDIVQQAIAAHPEIRRLRATVREAWTRIPQIRSLPDPMVQGTVYGEPMMMADGETRGTFMISQTIPSLKRLDAQTQQASFEALMMQQVLRAAEQRIAADVREAWYRLYLLEQLLRINDANEQLIESLVVAASAQVEVGRVTPGDVILGTLELSRVEDERLQLRQQLESRKAIFNQLLNRPGDSFVEIPHTIADVDVELSFDALRPLAVEQQPEITMARLRTQATAWGIRVARLERIPDLTLRYDHMFMRSNPGIRGSDPWQLGAGINIPLWHRRYDAVRQEATQKHVAAHAETEEIVRANEAMLLDYIERSRAADRTATLYRETILPQVGQALDADLRAYGQGSVQFERVIANARNQLTAQSALLRALTDKAIALARLEQTLGSPVPSENTDDDR